MKPTRGKPNDYAILLRDIKDRIQQAQTRAVLSANAELVGMYWDIGRMIHLRQEEEGWGTAVIPRIFLRVAKRTAGGERFF